MNTMNTLADFHSGEVVLYVPIHAHGDTNHPNVERGVVSSIGARLVFVKFDGQFGAKACEPRDLVKVYQK